MTAPDAQRSPDDREVADAALLRRIALRDRAALGELYDRFSRPLYATALRMLRDTAEAEDVIHDAFLAIWDKAGRFDPQRGSAFAWAVTMVRHRAIDHLRNRRTHDHLLEAANPADLGYEAAGAPASEAAIASKDDARMVHEALAGLPPEQKRALELAFFGGLTQQQIAQSLNEPIGTVKARIRRGLLKLRDLLLIRQ